MFQPPKLELLRKRWMIICFKLGYHFLLFYFQFRLGKKFGFDFNLNKDEKIGKLRTFVKDNRNKTEI